MILLWHVYMNILFIIVWICSIWNKFIECNLLTNQGQWKFDEWESRTVHKLCEQTVIYYTIINVLESTSALYKSHTSLQKYSTTSSSHKKPSFTNTSALLKYVSFYFISSLIPSFNEVFQAIIIWSRPWFFLRHAYLRSWHPQRCFCQPLGKMKWRSSYSWHSQIIWHQRYQ